MAVNFITTNPVEAGWDRQQARTDAATQSELRRVQTGEAIEQTRQRRGETQAMTDALAGLPPDADHLATLRALSRAPGLLPTTRVQTMQAIAQIEQSRATRAAAERAQAARERYQDQRLAQGERRIDERRDPVVPVQGEDGSTVYVPQSQAAGRRVGARPGGGGAPVVVQTPEGPRYVSRAEAPGMTPAPRPSNGAPVIVQTPEGPRYMPRSDAVGQTPGRAPSATPPSGPFPGNSMDAADRNILWRGNQPGGDTSSLEYYMAHQRYSQGRPTMVPSDPANPASPMVQAFIRPNMEGFAAPTYRQPSADEAPAAAPPAPAADSAPAATPSAPAAPAQPRPTAPVVDRAPGTARVSPTTAEHLRTFETEANRVVDALDNFDRLSQGASGVTRFNTWIGNPLSPQAAELQQAYNNMVMTLRSPAFANTGVLQPAEMAMLNRMLSNPETWRGAAMTPEARSRQLDQIRQMVRNGLARQQQSIRNPGGPTAPAPTAPTSPPAAPQQYRIENGRLVPNQRSDAGGSEQMAQAPATGPESDFGDGMGAGDRAQVPQPYRTRGMIRDDYGADVAPGQMMPGGFAPTGYRRESEYTNPGPSPQPAPRPERAPPAAPGAAAPRGQQALYGPSYVDTLFAQEGSGVNPRSSAAGYGQFLAGTWLGRPDAPGIFARLTQGNPNAQALLQRAWQGDQQAGQQILALRNNPEVARAAVGEYVRQTAATFRNAGVEVNDTNLALAHFLGPAGATRFLRAAQADPSMPVNRIMPAAVLRANPEVLMPGGQPITAGALYAQYARRYGGQMPAQPAPADAMPAASDPAMGSNPDQNAGIAPLAAPPVQAPRRSAGLQVPELYQPEALTPPAPDPAGALVQRDLSAPPVTAPVTTPPTPQAAAAPEAGAPMLSPLDTASPDQNQGAAPLAPQNGASAASPVPSGRREPTQQESLAADLRRVVGQMPTATPAAGPFALSDPATIREARTRFAESGRTADWNAGVASFLEDRFQRALEGAGSPHDFQRAVFASPRDRALLMATLAPEQQAAFRDLMRVADLASRGGVPGPIAQLAQGIRSGRGAGTLARLISDPDTVAQLRMLSQIAPDSPRALQIVNAILARTAAPEAQPMPAPGTPPAAIPRFRVQGGQLVRVE